jgi:Raf kinase inhibitor-like YbhB/YbcL family protein
MKLESDNFSANSLIPRKHACDGEATSPNLKWDDAPTETQSFTLIVEDPDAPNRSFTHWVVYDLSPQTRQLPENVPAKPILEGGGVHGTNDYNKFGYGPPCPPIGRHRYFFKLYALDTPLKLRPGATRNHVEAAMHGHVLAVAELIGLYERKS